MTREEAITIIRKEYLCVDRDCDIERSCGKCDLMMPSKEPILEAYKVAIKALEQQTCEDAVSREAVLGLFAQNADAVRPYSKTWEEVKDLPSVNPQPKIGHWEWVQYDSNPNIGNWHCSECRSVVIECADKKSKGDIPLYKYCPQCGCRIVEPQERNGEE